MEAATNVQQPVDQAARPGRSPVRVWLDELYAGCTGTLAVAVLLHAGALLLGGLLSAMLLGLALQPEVPAQGWAFVESSDRSLLLRCLFISLPAAGLIGGLYGPVLPRRLAARSALLRGQLENGVLSLALDPQAPLRIRSLNGRPALPGQSGVAASGLSCRERLIRLLEQYRHCAAAAGLPGVYAANGMSWLAGLSAVVLAALLWRTLPGVPAWPVCVSTLLAAGLLWSDELQWRVALRLALCEVLLPEDYAGASRQIRFT